jgi:hypothetical protein
VLGTFCQQKGIDLITMLDVLEAKNQGNNLFFPKDRHLNAAGNKVAAEVLDGKLGPILDGAWQAKAGAKTGTAPARAAAAVTP